MSKIAPILATVILATLLIFALQPSEDGGGDANTEQKEQAVQEIFVGPDYDPEMGAVTATSYDIATVTYTATPNPGYQWSHWEDSDGNILSYSTSRTFDANKDRLAKAVFEVEGEHVTHIAWRVPVFSEDGTVSDGITARYDLVLSSSEYKASIADKGIQRAGTTGHQWPTSLCSSSSIMDDVIQYLKTYTDGKTNLQKAMIILSFVQDSIGYQLDSDQFGTDEFWAAPLETLYSGFGDCEDTATLYVSIASALGLDVGYVMFESDRLNTPGTGHMSIAVALKGGESITNGATFVIDGTTFAYGETAFDMGEDGYRPLVGVLSDAYSIYDGMFTRVSYHDGEYSNGSTVSINRGGTAHSGTVIYGAAWENPPAVEMSVGDRFEYVPELSLPSQITASGSGMSWLTWDGSVLSGTAPSVGTYTVVLTAVSTIGPEQSASQTVTIVVSDSDGSGDRTWTYGSGGWSVEEKGNDAPGDDSSGVDAKVIMLVALVILVVALIVRRFV